MGGQPVVRHSESLDGGVYAQGHRVRVVAALRTLRVALARQVDRDDMEAPGEAGHHLPPRPPALRESREQDERRAGRLAAFDGVQAHAVGVDPAVDETGQLVQGQVVQGQVVDGAAC